MNHSQQNDAELDTEGKVIESLVALSELAQVLVHTRAPLRFSGALALGLASLGAASKIRRVWTRPPVVDLSGFFEEGWVVVPPMLMSTALADLVLRGTVQDTHKVAWQGRIELAVYVAQIDGMELGWLSNRSTFPMGGLDDTGPAPQLYARSLDAIRAFAHKRFWREAPSGRIRVSSTGVYSEFPLPEPMYGLREVDVVLAQARVALARGRPWTFLLDGEPGTGKTVLAVEVARRLGLRVAVLDAVHLSQRATFYSGRRTPLHFITDILRPDVLVLNDLDRLSLERQAELLELLDAVRSWAKICFLAVNHRKRLLDAIDRPGRIDAAVHCGGLPVDDLRAIDARLVEANRAAAVADWPIAYIVNALEQAQGAMGLDEAIGLVGERLAQARAREAS